MHGTNITNKIGIDGKLPRWLIIILGVYYFSVLVAGLLGNVFIISAVYRYQHMKKVVNIFLANLALSDLLFALLTLFDSITLYHNGNWIFGNAFCKFQSTLLELSYTVSVLTLTAVSTERYLSICYPYIKKRTYRQSITFSIVLWVIGFLFCSVLLYGYHQKLSGKSSIHMSYQCENNNWGEDSRLVFYTIHTIVVYILPICLMCLSHYKVSKVLVAQKLKCASEFDKKNKINNDQDNKRSVKKKEKRQRHHALASRTKIVKLLIAVIIIFFILWTPFIIIRLLIYIGVKIPNLLWRTSQLLIFGTTVVNCFIYSAMSKPFRASFKGLFTCKSHISRKDYSDSSMSKNKCHEILDLYKRQVSLNNTS